jgi:hypothetical protein
MEMLISACDIAVGMLEQLGIFGFAVMVSLLAMMSGGEGAVFFVPAFTAFLGLQPAVAIGTAFVTQLFGKTSGTISWACVGVREGKQLILWKVVFVLVALGIPFLIAGALLVGHLPAMALKLIFGLMAIGLAMVMAASMRKKRRCIRDGVSAGKVLGGRNFALCALGGLFTGLLAIGAGILNVFMLDRLGLKTRKAVATVVAVLPFTALLGLFVHLGAVDWDVAAFSISGVVVGGFIGPWAATRLETLGRISLVKGVFIGVTLASGAFMCASGLGMV